MAQNVNKIKLYYDPEGNTLNIWFGDPKKEHVSEETGEEVILNKDKRGKVIGFEKLNYKPSSGRVAGHVPIETIVA